MVVSTNNNVVYDCTYHVVWCSKYRRKVLVDGIDVRLKELLSLFAEELRIEIYEMEILPEHVHLLVSCDPQFGIHRTVKYLKGKSSRILRGEYKQLTTRLPTLWTNSYFVATVGGASLATIKRYIESQKRYE